jgi:hypothetical protein
MKEGEMVEVATLIKRDLVDFFDSLSYRLKVFNSTKKKTDRFLSSDFNVFEYIKPNETDLSSILRDLLDPNGPHGQGDTFLVEFLALIDRSECYCEGSQVKIGTEVSTDTNRRIDILIDIDQKIILPNGNRYFIAIENKPWTGDQVNQIDDYLKYLREKSHQATDPCIIYLTPDGSKPSHHSASDPERLMENRELILMSYSRCDNSVKNLSQWITTCQQKSESEKIRWFLRDFNLFINNEFQDTFLKEDDRGE